MPDYTDPRLTDEATGLPPLEEPEMEDDILLVLAWCGGVGVAMSPLTAESVPVRFLHVRGLAMPTDTERAGGATATWAQFHLAVPVDHAVDVASALATGGMFDE